MAKKSLTEIFPGATADATSLTLPAQIFSDQGVTLDVNTEPQDLIAAMAAHLFSILTVDNRTLNPDETIVITKDVPSLVTESGNVRLRDTFRINFYKTGSFDVFTPSDY